MVVELPPRAHDRCTGWKGLSRMKGNFHVRFLGECGRGNPPALTRQVCARVVTNEVEEDFQRSRKLLLGNGWTLADLLF